MQIELKRIQQAMGITFIYVTHDQEEALAMSDTVVVMDEGKIQQIGTPEDIYNEPKNAFVADFIGESNIIDGIMRGRRRGGDLQPPFPVPGQGLAPRTSRWTWSSAQRTWISSPRGQGQLKGTVTSVTFKGDAVRHHRGLLRLQVADPDHRSVPSGLPYRDQDRS